MSRKAVSARDFQAALAAFAALPRKAQVALAVLAVLVVGGYFAVEAARRAAETREANGTAAATAADGVASFVFCTWNVENLFDDKVDRRNPIDRPFDEGFANNDEVRKLKYDRISDGLVRINNGRGPDIIACMEVESVRAGELLMEALNAKVRDPGLRYKSMAMKNLDGGRHIAPCVISRLPLAQTATRLHGNRLRVLETRLIVNGHELVILATHWTSQLKQRDGSGGEAGRGNYARTVRGAVTGILKRKPDADVLVCGDFNDTPDADEVTRDLGAVGDAARVKASLGGDDPLLLDLMAGKPAERFGTLWYNGKPLIYDHICVSAGMLDGTGWACDPTSVETVTRGLIRAGGTRRQPWRFGDPDRNMRDSERGYADHFPVVARLTVEASAAKPE